MYVIVRGEEKMLKEKREIPVESELDKKEKKMKEEQREKGDRKRRTLEKGNGITNEEKKTLKTKLENLDRENQF